MTHAESRPEFHEYLVLLISRPCPPDWRAGQYAFNALLDVRPDLAERVRGRHLDPFHRSDVLPAFLRFLERHWDDL